jgi:CD109 antigen
MWTSFATALLLTFSLQLTRSEDSPAIFLVIAPKVIRPHSAYKVYISGEDAGSATPVSLKISHMNHTEPIASKDVVVEPGKSIQVLMEFKELPFDRYNFTVDSDAKGADGKQFSDRAVLHVDRHVQSIFVQTDKPIYKPGETVKFRVVVLNREFRPWQEMPTVNISISDPNRNLIKSWKNTEIGNNGLLSNQIALSAEPNLGDWVIKVESGSQREDHIFKVAQYVLPKFKATVKLPSFITFNNSKLIAEIGAMYTYGKAVKGEATVTLSQDVPSYYSRSQRGIKVTKTVTLDGPFAFVEFDAKRELNITDEYEKEIKVMATVTESVTGLQQNASSKVKMYQHPYKITLLNAPNTYKPGFPLNLTLQVMSQDDTPISDESPDALQISHGFSWDDNKGHLNSSIPANGLVHLSFPTPTNEFLHINTMEVKYKTLTVNIYLPRKLTTPNKLYMQLYMLTEKPKANEKIKLQVRTNRELRSLKYVLLCRGGVVAVEKLPDASAGSLEQDFEVNVPTICAPKGRLIAYSTFAKNNEIVADSVQFEMATSLDNFLNVNLSTKTAEPGSNLTLTLESKPKSTIALRGVDQSVLILRENSDIDMKAVDRSIDSTNHIFQQYRIWGGSNTHEIFDESGVVLLTNAYIDKPVADPIVYFESYNKIAPASIKFASAGMFAMADSQGAPAPSAERFQSKKTAAGGQGSQVRVRTEFPETWIFEEINGTDDGAMTNLVKTVPDTITSWIITGFAINSEDGLGVSREQAKLTTFRPFFISLNLPYSVVKGEVLALQVLVHNYMDKELAVDVIVDNQNGTFKYVEGKDGEDQSTLTKTITVGPSEVSSVSFLVIPLSFGIKKLNVKGVSPIAGDGVSRPLIVKPPGQKKTGSQAVLLDLRTEGTSFERNLTAEFPTSRVIGADTVKLILIGDMLGATVSNLDNLLQLPTGCGEQNMLNFVVDIVVLDYLTATSALTSAVRAKAIGYLEKGYQRQLTYLRRDGSFSAFGNSDTFGSTWLTAFVVRSFIQAKPYITVDPAIIMQSLKYLADRQQPYGGFEELGRVLHSELQGGSRSGGLAMSSYTLLTFIEAENHTDNFNYTSVIAKGLEYISKKNDITNDPYAVNLITYTLQVANHPEKKKFLELLDSIAKVEGDLKFWEQKVEPLNETSADGEKTAKGLWTHRHTIKPATVEMTAYGLLSALLDGRITDSLPIARWLTTQRNSQGGFKSTQDTVVGVTALAKFGLATRTKDSNLEVTAEYLGGQKQLKINHDNEMEQQEVFLPEGAHYANLKTTGVGSGLAQLSWSYYVEDNDTAPAFEIDVKVKDNGTPKKLELNVCGKYKGHGKSNMALMEVGLPTGYAFEKEELGKLKSGDVMRYETEDSDTKLIIYFDSISKEPKCVDLYASLTHPVAKQAPAHIKLYDYYDTTKQASASYEGPKISICDICEYDKTCKLENCV